MDILLSLKDNFQTIHSVYSETKAEINKEIEKIDEQISVLKGKKEALKDKRDELSAPDYIELFVKPLISELNTIVASRGFQFSTKNLIPRGLMAWVSVYQDYENSDCVTHAYFEFKFSGNKFYLKKKSGEYKNDHSISALNDCNAQVVELCSMEQLLQHIAEAEECARNYFKEYIDRFGSVEATVSAACDGQLSYESLPVEYHTGKIIEQNIRNGGNSIRYVPEFTVI